jgi:hypothetical protein
MEIEEQAAMSAHSRLSDDFKTFSMAQSYRIIGPKSI